MFIIKYDILISAAFIALTLLVIFCFFGLDITTKLFACLFYLVTIESKVTETSRSNFESQKLYLKNIEELQTNML